METYTFLNFSNVKKQVICGGRVISDVFAITFNKFNNEIYGNIILCNLHEELPIEFDIVIKGYMVLCKCKIEKDITKVDLNKESVPFTAKDLIKFK